jgi:FAD/FMN-containing dehydrogenase
MADLDQLRAALGDIPVITDPAKVQLKSRDFYWYSPVLKRQLERVCADLVVEPRDEAEVIRALGACHRQRVPVTVRGGGTGNYGQAMPLKGGVVLDLSRLDHIIEIDLGWVRAQAGAKLAQIDRACQEHSRQELRLHPSTLKMGTIGGFVAGGSSGVGSIGWGILRDRGNILAVRVVTMEAQPRVLELEGDAIQQVNHAYGTNGVITEVEMPLAPAHAWVDLILGFADFTTAVRFADALARQDALTKKLITALAAPIAELYFRPFKSRIPDGTHAVLLMIAEPWLPAFRDFVKAWPGKSCSSVRRATPSARRCRSSSCPGTIPPCTRSESTRPSPIFRCTTRHPITCTARCTCTSASVTRSWRISSSYASMGRSPAWDCRSCASRPRSASMRSSAITRITAARSSTRTPSPSRKAA